MSYKEPEVINPVKEEVKDEVTSTIQKELDSVNKKLEKLDTYLATDKFKDLPEDKQGLINQLVTALQNEKEAIVGILEGGDTTVDPYLGAEETKKDPSINPSLPEFSL